MRWEALTLLFSGKTLWSRGYLFFGSWENVICKSGNLHFWMEDEVGVEMEEKWGGLFVYSINTFIVVYTKFLSWH